MAIAISLAACGPMVACGGGARDTVRDVANNLTTVPTNGATGHVAADADALHPPSYGFGDVPQRPPSVRIATPASRAFASDFIGPIWWQGLLVVGSTAHGLTAFDPHAGRARWTVPIVARPAEPWVDDDLLWLASECGEAHSLGCLRGMSSDGAVRATQRIAGDVPAFFEARGPAFLRRTAKAWHWQRGGAAITWHGDAAAQAAAPLQPRIDWQGSIGIEGEDLVARSKTGRELWRLRERFIAVAGIVPGAEGEWPTVRTVRKDIDESAGVFDVIDVDASGSRGFVAWRPAPGIQLMDFALAPNGALLLSLRADASMNHDYLVLYDSGGSIHWWFALPERPHIDGAQVVRMPSGWAAWWDGAEIGIWSDMPDGAGPSVPVSN